MRILVVDDSDVHRQLVGGLLEDEDGLELEFAVDGQEALDRLDAGDAPPDLIITDLVMPRVDGLELVSKVRDSFPALPVILITAQGNEEIAARALSAGAASYVPKANLAQHLAETVRDALEVVADYQKRTAALTTMVTSKTQFVLDNRRALFRPLIAHLSETLAHLGLADENELMRVGVALEEALANAAEHGNLGLDSAQREHDRKGYLEKARKRLDEPPYRDRRVRLLFDANREQAQFVVQDEGEGFDPQDLPDPTDASNLLKASGRGILLMRTFMDDVRYNDDGTEVTMIKRWPANGGPPKTSESTL